MARPKKSADEKMVVVPFRLPSSFVAELEAEAQERGLSRSDIVRSRLQADAVPLTGLPTPAKRGRLKNASRGDTALMRRLAAIGNNVNQIAYAVNSAALIGKRTDAMALLIELQSIEVQLRRLANISNND